MVTTKAWAVVWKKNSLQTDKLAENGSFGQCMIFDTRSDARFYKFPEGKIERVVILTKKEYDKLKAKGKEALPKATNR